MALCCFAATSIGGAFAAETYAPIRLEAGTWKAEATFYDPTTGKATGHASGVQRNVMLVNKHWITNDLAVPASGKNPAYEGHGVWGYDPVAKTYVDTWVDTNDGAVRTDYGYWNAQKSTMFWSSKQPDGQGHFVDWRAVEKFDGAHRTFDFYICGMESGTPHRIAHFDFTRENV